MNMRTHFLSGRRALLLGAFVVAGVPLLQGCFPVVAAGIGASAMMVADRRSSGAYIDDEGIEWKVVDQIGKHFGKLNHVNVTSYNRNVLLTGEAQNEEVRAEVQRVAGGVANVRSVINELLVGPPSSLPSRSNDALITSNVKSRFMSSGRFSANHVKVVTEAGTVFLLGLVTSEEADAAADIARTSHGVQKVVKAFEYITVAPVATAAPPAATTAPTATTAPVNPPEAP